MEFALETANRISYQSEPLEISSAVTRTEYYPAHFHTNPFQLELGVNGATECGIGRRRLCRDCPVPALLARRNGQEPRQRADTQTLLARLVSRTTAFQLMTLKWRLKSALRRRYRRYDRLP